MKLIGLARLGRDAELRYTQQGDAVAGFSAAYNFGKKDDAGNRATQWVECSLWGKRAESLAQYLLKGTLVNIMLDDVHVEQFEGRNGPGVKLTGRVADLEFAGGRKDDEQPVHSKTQDSMNAQAPRNGYADAKGKAQPPLEQRPPASSLDDMQDDIPF